jgi:hypothetical protein
MVFIDLAIEGENEATIGRKHGLMPGRGQVNYCQPPMTKADPRSLVDPGAVIVRTAMRDSAGHAG